MSKKPRYADVAMPMPSNFDTLCATAKIVWLGSLAKDIKYKGLFAELDKDGANIEDVMFDILDSPDGKLHRRTVANMLSTFSMAQRITFVRQLLPDDFSYTSLKADNLVVQFSKKDNMLWGIGSILHEALSALGTKYSPFWSSHWIVGHMRFVLLRCAMRDARNSYDIMNESWTGRGYDDFYERQTPAGLLSQQTQARALAALIRNVGPEASSEYVDVFHVVNPKRPGLSSTYAPSAAATKSKAPLNWHELHAFACVQYGMYHGDSDMPVVCLRLHKSVASAATFRNEPAVFVVLVDTTLCAESIDLDIPTHCKRCKTVFKPTTMKQQVKFESRTCRTNQLGTKESVPNDLKDYIAVCEKCKYAHGCRTYTFKSP